MQEKKYLCIRIKTSYRHITVIAATDWQHLWLPTQDQAHLHIIMDEEGTNVPPSFLRDFGQSVVPKEV